MIQEILSPYLKEIIVEPSTMILEQQEVARRIFFIKKGCLRQYILKDGIEITIQFFLEGDCVSSAESFKMNKPSQFYIQSIEKTHLLYLSKSTFRKIAAQNPVLLNQINDHIFNQFIHFQNLFLSRLMYSPQDRYQDLLENQPKLIQRIPSKHLASFLGITPVSLSRIRGRNK